MTSSQTADPANVGAVPAPNSVARAGYRADIDGLRAIAVLAVVFGHAGVDGFAGGFVGVDMFFVISGYLITRNLENAPPSGWRGLAAFYGRRMRRTLPALYLVATLTLAASLVLLMPGELVSLARSLLGLILFVPNIVFLNQTGYFDAAAVTKPLLHTWSLGVEEQFYLVAPLIPFMLRSFGRSRRRLILIGLAGMAFGVFFALHAVRSEAAFYLMPARLWEFLAGSLVAERILPPCPPRLGEFLAGVALVLLAIAVTGFSASTAYPTLLPCLATATLIHIGSSPSGSVMNRLISAPPLAGVGLISYSVYLWHWPLLVFARFAGLTFSPASAGLAAVGLLGLSALSWRVIEVPFRAPGVLRRHAGLILAPVPIVIAAASVGLIATRGLPVRFDPAVAQVASYFDYADRRQFREGSCFITSKYGSARYFEPATCLHKSATTPNILIIGNSHAAHLWIGFKTVFADANIMQASASGCHPIVRPVGLGYCTDLMRALREQFLPRLAPLDAIVLSADWVPDDAESAAEAIAFYGRFARKVIVVGGVPAHDSALPDLLARSLLRHDPQLVLDHQSPAPFILDQRFKAALPPATYVALTDGLCPQRRCLVYAAPDVPLSFDTDHLTTEGSILVARYIDSLNILGVR